jgi:hypothetical protein
MKKIKLWYITTEKECYNVMHTQFVGKHRIVAKFYFDYSLSKTRALKAAKVLVQQLYEYHPSEKA